VGSPVLCFDNQFETADDHRVPRIDFSLEILMPLTYVPFVLPQS